MSLITRLNRNLKKRIYVVKTSYPKRLKYSRNKAPIFR